MKIFITGATGFLGQYLVRALSPMCEKIYILTRNSHYSAFNDLLNIELVKGDITQPEIIESFECRQKILSECDFAVHAAALYDIEASYVESYLHNVVGTQNTLRFVKKMQKNKAFYYLSTIAVGDDKSTFLLEDQLPERSHFKDSYSKTKYLAEKIVRESTLDMSVRIIRPGIIIGDSVTGEMSKTDGPYYFIQAMRKYADQLKMIPLIPLSFDPKTRIPLIPVDYCARYVATLIARDSGEKITKTYHLTAHEQHTLRDFMNDLNASL